jgi:hypothetical protein
LKTSVESQRRGLSPSIKFWLSRNGDNGDPFFWELAVDTRAAEPSQPERISAGSYYELIPRPAALFREIAEQE